MRDGIVSGSSCGSVGVLSAHGRDQHRDDQEHRETAAQILEAREHAANERVFGDIFENRVEDRHGEQRQHQAEQLSAGHHHADGAVGGRSGAGGNHQRNHARDQRDGGHQDGTQAVAIGLHDRVVAVETRGAETVHVVDLQDRVFLHDAE